MVLDDRMKCIADCVVKGGVLADIGTDHAFLPVYLVQNGIINKAVACDINEMPLKKAEANISKNGLNDKIDVLLTDGLHGVEKYNPDTVVIAGMGGELIVKILSESKLEKDKIKFVLQPMTKEETVREYLFDNGYNITDEFVVKDGCKFYQIEVCFYDGIKREYTTEELSLGKINTKKHAPVFFEFARKICKRKQTRLDGLKKGGYDVSVLEEEINRIKKICGENNNYDK